MKFESNANSMFETELGYDILHLHYQNAFNDVKYDSCGAWRVI